MTRIHSTRRKYVCRESLKEHDLYTITCLYSTGSLKIDPSSDSVLKKNVCRGEKGVFSFFWFNYCVFDLTIFRRLLHVDVVIMMFSLRLNFEIFNFLKCSNEKLLWIVYQIEQNDHFQPHIGTKQSIFHKTNNIRQIWINQISLYSESIAIKS